ncbi:germin 9-3 [Olea europaea subsp. europaea]|uniref:Germin-like protein n=1 Tax=Olea europaea subsp. europaea TaxID=158383 RepID=A0A8S0PDE9_OLEEU|nr:germin 9-3 [Olea europaea subsp. europaea]
MASFLVTKHFLLGFLVIIATSWIVQASDPDILSDFIVPPNVTAPDGNVFTFTDLRGVLDSIPPDFKVTKARKVEFSALDGQSVSMAVLQFPAELLFVVEGSLEVGFVDTTNKLFTQTLQTANIFVFPKGLVHYQYDSDPKEPAIADSAFGSASSGRASLPTTLFATGVEETILAESFKTDVITIQKLKAGLAPKA